MGDGLLTIEEAAGVLRVSEATVYRLMSRGKIAVVKVGRATRIRQSELDDFVRRNTRPAKEE